MSEVTTRPATRATKAPARASKCHQNHKMPRVNEPAEPAPAVSSIIVLTLRPNGKKFNGNRVERAQEAGFDWLDNVNAIGHKCHDTGREIARFVVRGMDEAMGDLREIQFHIDLANCAIEYGLGKSLIKKLGNYAILIGGHIADGMGAQLGDEALSALAYHIDAAMNTRIAAERQSRMVTLPTGEKRELSELSFAYGVWREAGAKKTSYRDVHFDAPALHYYEGRALGMQMAGEIVQFFRKHKTRKLRLDCILREVAERSGNSYGSVNKADVGNVSLGFMDVISVLIEIGARNLNQKWLDAQIANEKLRHEEFILAEAARKTEFVARMKAARQAKQRGRNA